MRLNELEKSFYDVFLIINAYDSLFTKALLKKQKFKLTYEEKFILRRMYDSYEIYKQYLYSDFKKMCINMALLTKQDIIVSAMNIVSELRPDIIDKIKNE